MLQVHDLTVSFRTPEGAATVVDHVGLRVDAGERVAIVGESGCGKSTLLRAIMHLLNPRSASVSGSVMFEGANLLASSAAELGRIRGRRMSMIFQDPTAALNPVFTIGDQLGDVLLRHRMAASRKSALAILADALKRVAILDPERVLAAYPFELSGGMNQRVMIVLAFIGNPALILADEPGTALDVSVQAKTLRVLRDMTERSGSSVLMVTHNLGVVRQFAQRVYVMYAGSIVEHGPAGQIFASPAHPYTQALLAAVPRLSGTQMPMSIRGAIPDIFNLPEGCRFAPRCPHAFPACSRLPAMIAVSEGHHAACALHAGGGR